ncbi:hypothetical protein Tco_0428428 [Tanacetum coccineum]
MKHPPGRIPASRALEVMDNHVNHNVKESRRIYKLKIAQNIDHLASELSTCHPPSSCRADLLKNEHSSIIVFQPHRSNIAEVPVGINIASLYDSYETAARYIGIIIGDFVLEVDLNPSGSLTPLMN